MVVSRGGVKGGLGLEGVRGGGLGVRSKSGVKGV